MKKITGMNYLLVLCMTFALLSCNRDNEIGVSSETLKAASPGSGGTTQVTRLTKAQYQEYSDELFSELQAVIDYAENLAGTCVLETYTQNQWLDVMSFYVWENYQSDYDSVYNSFSETNNVWSSGQMPYTLSEQWQEDIYDEIFQYLDGLPLNNYYQDANEYLDDKFDEVYAMQVSIQEQDVMLSSITVTKGWITFIQNNPECFGMSVSDWPDWSAVAKCTVSTMGGWFGGALAGGAGGATIAGGIVKAGVALSTTGVGAVIVAGAFVGAATGAAIASVQGGCWDL